MNYNETSGNVIVLKFESRARTQSRPRSSIWRSLTSILNLHLIDPTICFPRCEGRDSIQLLCRVLIKMYFLYSCRHHVALHFISSCHNTILHFLSCYYPLCNLICYKSSCMHCETSHLVLKLMSKTSQTSTYLAFNADAFSDSSALNESLRCVKHSKKVHWSWHHYHNHRQANHVRSQYYAVGPTRSA